MTTLIPKINFKNGTATPAGAINRTVNEKAQDTVSVKDFGAIGNGVTDDTAAFNAAWAYGNPQAVLVPAASYKITGTVTGKFYSFGVVTIVTGTVTSITNLVP
jgi:polygalacturonase